MITKEKIVNARFGRKGKGYDVVDVDRFLDELASDVEKLEAERQKEAEEREKMKQSEQAVAQALLIAQSTAQKIQSDAEKKAAEILAQAEKEAEDLKVRTEAEILIARQRSEAECATLIKRIKELREYSETYREAILKDMDAQREAFLAGFLSDALIEDAPSLEESAPELPEVQQEKAAEQDESKSELETGDMGTINLQDIISSLPQTDTELKALIDEIM